MRHPLTFEKTLVLVSTALLVLVAQGCDDGEVPPRDGGVDAADVDPDGASDAESEAQPDAPPSCEIDSWTLGDDDVPSAPPDGLGGTGDLAVETDVLRAVFSAVDRPVGIAPTGGTLMDLHLLGRGDHMNELSQMAGPGQGLVVAYSALEVDDSTPGLLVVEAVGHVQPQPAPAGSEPIVTPAPERDLAFVTRYEFRCGSQVVGMESTVTNRGDVEYETETAFAPMDLMLWGGNSLIPFCPAPGQGDRCTPFEIENPLVGLVQTPWFGSTGSQVGDEGSFAFYVDDPEAPSFVGIHREDVSAFGFFVMGRNSLVVGQSRSFRRAIAVGGAADTASAADLALEALTHNDRVGLEVATVVGIVAPPAGEELSPDPYQRPLVMLATAAAGEDPLDPARWTPVNMVRVGSDGAFSARVPAGDVAWELRPLRGSAVVRGSGGTVEPGGMLDLGILSYDSAPRLVVHVRDVSSGASEGTLARVVVVGVGETEDPILGSTAAGSPAGNMALTDVAGDVELNLPAGSYQVWATRGMRSSISRELVELGDEAADVEVTLEVEQLDVIPDEGFLTADFHVHSSASFDSSLPTTDRLLAFLAEGVDAIVSTEHDVIFDYGPTLASLEETFPEEWRGRIGTFVGIESTPSTPWEDFVNTIGHHNAFPLTHVPTASAGGAPADELVNLAELYGRLRALPSPVEQPLLQLNHGRGSRYGTVWLGYFDSCGFDPAAPFDESSLCFGAESASGVRPWDFDLMEIINGKNAEQFVHMSRDWLAMVRFSPGVSSPLATANSDSHRLVRDQAGYPVTVLRTDIPLGDLDDEALVQTVRGGAMAGALGVFVWATAREEGSEIDVGPGRTVLAAPSGRVVLQVRVAAAPWVRVDEIRVRVDGAVLRRLGSDELLTPEDPFGVDGVVRFEGEVDLSDTILVADAFITVEAGFPLSRVGDLDGDGVVDATDNNGDGSVDEDDLEGGIAIGEPSPEMAIIAPGAHAVGYINPIFVDIDGDGVWSAPGTPLTD